MMTSDNFKTLSNVQMHKLLNAQIPDDDGEKADHDFDVVTHNFCNYKDDGKGLQIDVEKIVGDAADGVSI